MNELKHFNNHPRDHFSWSQFDRFRRSPDDYVKTYIYGDNPTNPRMELGKYVAEMIEHDEHQEDPVLEQLRIFLPQYSHKEFPLEVAFNSIKLVGKPDGLEMDPWTIGEYKTGKLWTQKMADETQQLTWYALMLHLIYKVKPENIKMTLHWMPTVMNDALVQPTGAIENFETKRTTRQCFELGKEIVDMWGKIGAYCGEHYRSLGL